MAIATTGVAAVTCSQGAARNRDARPTISPAPSLRRVKGRPSRCASSLASPSINTRIWAPMAPSLLIACPSAKRRSRLSASRRRLASGERREKGARVRQLWRWSVEVETMGFRALPWVGVP